MDPVLPKWACAGGALRMEKRFLEVMVTREMLLEQDWTLSLGPQLDLVTKCGQSKPSRRSLVSSLEKNEEAT